jgi:tetratricopeptide (TPR) repeat protein
LQDFYSQALEEAPPTAPLQRAVYFSNCAACHMRLEEHSEAAIDCSAALDLRPDYVKALVRRAAALEAMKNYEEALMDLRKALEAEPGNKAAEEGVKRMEPLAAAAAEVAKDEMIGKLKDLGNTLLGKFGMSLDNFKTEKDPDTGSYSIKFQQ